MIFASTNEAGIPKWKFLLSLPIGGRFVTRRVIKMEEKCISCRKPYEEHVAPIYPHTSACSMFSPDKFRVGKTFCVQTKRMGGAFGFIVGSVSINEKIYYYTYLTQSDGSYTIHQDNSEDVSIYEDTDKNPYRKEQTGGPYGKCGPRIQYHVPNGTIVVNMQADITKIK